MIKTEVMALLRANRNPRGEKHWANPDIETGGLKSFGIGLTQLRKLAKQVGRKHELALELWATDNHDAKIVGLLIDEPKRITREQAEEQVEGVEPGMLSHVFSSCDATLPKVSFAFDLAREWIESGHGLRRQCGYGLVYELSKDQRNQGLTDEFCLECIKRIRDEIESEERAVRLAMGGALMGLGKRNRKLNQAAITVAKAIGPIDCGEPKCSPLDVLKHLTSNHLKKKVGS